jgi:hypothetical protein
MQGRDYSKAYLSIVDSNKWGTVSDGDKEWLEGKDVGGWWRQWNGELMKLHNASNRRLQAAILLKADAARSLKGTGWYDDAVRQEGGLVPLSRPVAGHTPRIRDFDRDEAMKKIREETGE